MSSNHETTILRPRDPSLTNSDHWPIFTIKNAIVFDPLDPTATPQNLLHAGAYRPLTLSGKLDSPQPDLVLEKSYHRTQPIEVTGVTQFSYGQYEDGTLDIWAAGQAGWYTVKPSRVYKDIYTDMVQAVQLLYFVADAYKETKRYSDLDAPALFEKYCHEHSDACSTLDNAELVFAQHRYFLFASMLDGKEGLQWARAPVFKYLEATYPDDAALIRQRRAFSMKPPKAPSSKRSTHSPAPSNASLKRKRKERATTPTSTAGPVRRSKSRSVSVATTATSGSVMGPSGSQALASRSKSQRASRKSSVQPQPIPSPPKEPSLASDADSEESSEASHRGYKGKTRSSLRPKPAKYVVQKPLANQVDGNDADDDETEADTKGPAPATPASKRKMMDDLRSRRAKRRNSEMQAGDSDEEMITDPDLDVEGSASTPSEDHEDARKPQDATTSPPAARNVPALPFRFRDGKDGEDDGDVWRCETDGCMHRVYAASEPASQTLIYDHQRMHEYDDDQRVQLVRRMQAPWLPVGRLMGRVRDLAAQNGTPAPIVQRF